MEAPTTVYYMASPSMPPGLRQHFKLWPVATVIVIGHFAGDVGLRRLLETALAQKPRFQDTVIAPALIDPQTAAPVRAVFDEVATGAEFGFLAEADLVAALRAQDKADRAVGACYNAATELLVFFTGDAKRLVVPVATIAEDKVMGKPDLQAVALIDGGKTVTFGRRYRVTFEDIRIGLDPVYRTAVRQRDREQDLTFGGGLRRARIDKGFEQKDFGLSDRTLRRIETGIIKESGIRLATRKLIEKKLGMTFDEIRRYIRRHPTI